MSSSISVGIAGVIPIYQVMRTFDAIYMAIAVLLVYDALLCMDREVQYVWRASASGFRKLSRVLYIYNRYMSMLWNILNAVLIGAVSDNTCNTLYWSRAILDVLALLGPASFTTLRVYALSGRNKVLTGIVLALSMGPFLLNVCTLYQTAPINLPPLYNCTMLGVQDTSVTGYIGTVVESRTCLILADLVAVVVTWRRTHTACRTSSMFGGSSLEQVLWANGNIYFCSLVAMNIAYMIFVLLSIMTDGSQGLDALCFIDPISSTSNSRFLLALYETNARMEKGCASTSSFSGSTVDFRGANPEAPSGFPELLSTLAGPICSVPDDGSEMFDSYAKSWRKVEAEEMGAEAAVEESPSGEVGDSEWVHV